MKTGKFVSLALAVLLLLGTFCSCGSSGNGDKIIIGGTGPLTGTASTYGNSVKNGATVAIDEINAAGGVGTAGIKLSLEFMDDEADGAKAKTAYENLMDKGMQIFMGAVTSGASVSLNDLIKNDGILQITPSASQLEAASVNSNAFRICFTDPLQGTEIAKYIYNTLGYKKAAIIYNQDDSYSTGIYEAFKKEWATLGGSVSVDVSFGKDTADFSAQITKIASSDAQFILLPIYAEKAAQIAIAANTKGVKLPLIGGDGLDGILTYLEGDNAKLVEGMIYLTPFVATDKNESIQKFVSAYKAKFGADPDQFAADAYDAIYVIKAALEKTGVTDAKSIDNAKLVEAMNGLTVDGLTGKMTFSADGESNKTGKFAKIVDGAYVAQ